jgi:hypothetical protein
VQYPEASKFLDQFFEKLAMTTDC